MPSEQQFLPETILPLLLFAFAGAFSPGPNNIMATASGAAVGFRRTLPQIAGVTIGFGVMLAVLAFVGGGIFSTYPALHSWLRIVGALYLLYLAWRIAGAGNPTISASEQQSLTFLEAALFQWANPKAWTLALGAIAAFTPVGRPIASDLAIIIGVFAVMTVASLVMWCLFGVTVARFLTSPRALRVFNLTMAALVALSVLLLFL